MKSGRPGRIVLAALALSMAGCGLRLAPDRYYVVGVRDARDIVGAAERIVDLRSPDEYELGHLPGAVSIPLNQLWFRMDELPWRPDAVIVAYDDDPVRQARAGELLKAEGYYRVHFLRGGFAAWRGSGEPVSRAPAPSAVYRQRDGDW